MPIQIGSVPLYADEQSGQVFVDQDDVAASTDDDVEDESGAYFPVGQRLREGHLKRVQRRIGRLQRREGRVEERIARHGGNVNMSVAPADLYQQAAASGMVQENQYDGLGSVSVAASSTNTLSDTINRNLWAKSLVLDSDSPSNILITSITVAGLPINVGAKGAPLSMFATNSTRFGISFGRKLALTGQTFAVNLANSDAGSAHLVSGGIICDELNPYAMQLWMEQMLLTAATQGFAG
jgi:hypothetical protein